MAGVFDDFAPVTAAPGDATLGDVFADFRVPRARAPRGGRPLAESQQAPQRPVLPPTAISTAMQALGLDRAVPVPAFLAPTRVQTPEAAQAAAEVAHAIATELQSRRRVEAAFGTPTIGDAGIAMTSALLDALGGGAEFVGRKVAQFYNAAVGRPLDALTGEGGVIHDPVLGDLPAPTMTVDNVAGGWPALARSAAEALRGATTPAAAQAVEDSQFGTTHDAAGNLSGLTLGRRPSAAGYGLQAASLLGYLAPVLASSGAGLGTFGTAATGTVIGGGADRQQAGQAIDQSFAAGTLQETDRFRALLAEGYTPEGAHAVIRRDAEDTGGDWGAVLGGVGGGLTERLLNPGRLLANAPGLARVAGLTLGGGALGSAQNVAEGVATQAGAKAAGGGESVSLGDGLPQNALFGFAGAAVPGAFGAVTTSGDHARIEAALSTARNPKATPARRLAALLELDQAGVRPSLRSFATETPQASVAASASPLADTQADTQAAPAPAAPSRPAAAPATRTGFGSPDTAAVDHIANPSNPARRGVGLHVGVASVEPGNTVTAGPAAPEGRSRDAVEGDQAPDRGVRQEGGTTADQRQAAPAEPAARTEIGPARDAAGVTRAQLIEDWRNAPDARSKAAAAQAIAAFDASQRAAVAPEAPTPTPDTTAADAAAATPDVPPVPVDVPADAAPPADGLVTQNRDRSGEASATRQAGETVSASEQPLNARKGGTDEAAPSGIPQGLRAAPTTDTDDLAAAVNRGLAGTGAAERVRFHAVATDDLPQDARLAIEAFGEATGTRVIVFRNLTPGVFDPNGANLRDGRLFVNESADRPLVTVAAHEFTHQLKADAPELYARLEAEVRRQGDLGAYAAGLRQRGETRPETLAPEELTGDAVGDAMSDPEFLRRVARENPATFRRMADAFMRFLDGLLAKLGRRPDLGSNRYLQDVQAFRDVLASVLRDYAPRYSAPEPGHPVADAANYSRREGGSPDTPAFRRWFGGSYDAGNPDIRFSRRQGDLVSRDAELFRAEAAAARQAAEAAREESIGSLRAMGYAVGTPQWQAATGRWEGPAGMVNQARVKLQDRMLAIREVQGDVEQAIGGLLDDSMNAYRLENLLSGRAGDVARRVQVRFADPIGEALRQQGLRMSQLEDYLLARHAAERNAHIATIRPDMPDAGSGITTQAAADVLAGRAPGPYSGTVMTATDRAKLAEVAKQVDALREFTLRTLLDSRQITQARYDALRAQYRNYVKLAGSADGGESTPVGSGGRFNAKANIQRAFGRGEGNLPQNIVGEMLADALRAGVGAERLRVGRAMLRLALAHPNDAVWKVEPAEMEWAFHEGRGEAYLRPKRGALTDHEMLVNEGDRHYRIVFHDPQVGRAMAALNPQDLNVVQTILGGTMRYLSATLTSYNPGFVPLNLIRDATLAFPAIAAEHGLAAAATALKHYPAALAAIYSDVRHASGNADAVNKRVLDYAREYAEAGAYTSLMPDVSAKKAGKALQESVLSFNDAVREGRGFLATKKAIGGVLDGIEHVNTAIENATRLSAYIALREKGTTPEAAASYAKSLTVNFTRKGEWSSVASTLYLFFNAATQSAHRIATLIRDNPKKIGGGLAALAAMQAAFALSMMGEEDQNGMTLWDRIPKWRKSNSLVIPAPWTKDGYLAIPIAYGFNWFAYMGGRLAQFAAGRDRENDSILNDSVGSLVGAFSPLPLDEGLQGGLPFLVGKVMNLASNRDDLGRPIARDDSFGKFQRPASAMGREDTAQVYKDASTLLNRLGGGDDLTPPRYMQSLTDVAPEKLEYLVGLAFGGLGSTTNKALATVDNLRAGTKGPAELLRDAPIIGSFGITTNEAQAVAGRYYDARETYERNLERLRVAYAKGGETGFEAERARLGPTYADVSLSRYKASGREHRSGDVRLSTGGRPLLVAGTTTGTLATYKRADDAIRDWTRTIATLRGDRALTGREVVEALVRTPDAYSRAAVAGMLGVTLDDRPVDAPARRRAVDYAQVQRAREQSDVLRHLNQQGAAP